MNIIRNVEIPELPFLNSGKVREIFDLDKYLLLVTSDRISAFDVILNDAIPQKGFVLNNLSGFWFSRFENDIKTAMVTINVNKFASYCPEYKDVFTKYYDVLEGRSMLMKKVKPLPIESIVRGYITGSGWESYQENGKICGITLPAGLVESEKLPEPIFTPTTKAELGLHDEHITLENMTEILGSKILAEKIRDLSLNIYRKAAEFALERGIIIADTKFEFGLFDDELYWIDEALTPDSSRFWPSNLYKPGKSQPSFDKQYVRDYLKLIGWNKKPPVPDLPPDVISNTSKKYMEAYVKLA